VPAVVKLRVTGLAELVAACASLADPARLNSRFGDASRRAAELVVGRTKALANARGHGASIKAASLLYTEPTPDGTAIVIDPSKHPAMIGGLFGAAHDRDRMRHRQLGRPHPRRQLQGLQPVPAQDPASHRRGRRPTTNANGSSTSS
jgi:hypothetical protein